MFFISMKNTPIDESSELDWKTKERTDKHFFIFNDWNIPQGQIYVYGSLPSKPSHGYYQKEIFYF